LKHGEKLHRDFEEKFPPIKQLHAKCDDKQTVHPLLCSTANNTL